MAKKRVRTQTNNQFAEVVSANVPRSTFWRNSSLKTSFNAGKLVPIYLDEVLPGDTIEMDMASVSRLTTPIFPTMDTAYIDFYAFFVPNRLVWDDWEQLIANTNKTGAWAPTTPPALVPGVAPGTMASGQIGDYYGLPIGFSSSDVRGMFVSALPFRGYALIWNEWFRDENLQAPLAINKSSNTDTTSYIYRPNNQLLSVNKKQDYFTSALPAPQKGDSVLIPLELQEYLPVIVRNTELVSPTISGNSLRWYDGSNNTITGNHLLGADGDGTTIRGATGEVEGFVRPANLWASTGGQISDATISELRTAFQIQKLFERDARGGTRYIEMLKSHFGVDAQDYRLQRPEFLGHRSTMIGIQQVAQTSSTDATSPQGNLSAFSYTLDKGTLFKKSFVEHGFIHIFAVARQPKTYQNGLSKLFTKRERLDFYVPVLAHISEQPIYNREIYLKTDGTSTEQLEYNSGIFGYQEAWAEYRYKPNQVTGQMRSGVTGSLDAWHYADNYSSEVYLSNAWIKDNSEENINRTLAVSSSVSNQIIMDIAFKNKSTRPMPLRSIPGMVDHF